MRDGKYCQDKTDYARLNGIILSWINYVLLALISTGPVMHKRILDPS
jgi:hypothetical protein